MARRLTRKQIKKDEFVTVIDRATHWLGQNWRQAAMGLGGAVLVGLVYWGVTAFLASRATSAGEALGRALETYNAPVGAAAPADAKITFATEAERTNAAEQGFKQLASRYRLTPQARMARLYLARIAADRGDLAGARKQLESLARKRSGEPVVRMAMLDLVRLRVASGEGEQVVADLEAMAAGKDPRLPADLALRELARLWERAGKPEQAGKALRRLVDEHSDSPFAAEARQQLAANS